MSGNVPLRSPTPPNMASSNFASKFRSGRSMPSWVTNSSDRVGPAPPPPPNSNRDNNADPEYEVIDVANQQQYSNAPPPVPLKSVDIKRMSVMKCELCGSVSPIVRCQQCDHNMFCASCDDRYHRHPKRQSHIRTPVEPQSVAAPAEKPPLPPKGEGGPGGPLPPPRKNKRPGSFLFPSPLLGRKQDQDPDQTIPTTVPQGFSTQKPPQPPPSPALSLREKMNSLKRFIHPSNRPLPDPPENKMHSSNSSLDTISKQSTTTGVKSVSSTMEKIKNNTAATLDRMNMLQQRYRQHQEAMKADSDRSRRASVSSNMDLQNVRSKPPSVSSTLHHYQQQQFHHQPQQAFQSRWMEPPTPRMRSGSVASGINLLPNTSATNNRLSTASSPIPPSVVVSSSSETKSGNSSSANNPSSSLFVPSSLQQRGDFNASPDSAAMSPTNPRSTSVFNLNTFHQQQQQQQQQANMWGFSPLHQAQSMAHFNPMHWNQMNQWMANQSQNGSNMSLNLPSSSHDQSGYPNHPGGWNNAWAGMYPYPMGMMPMMPGMAIPPPRSRAHSRSRAASPALSIKSRKSTMSMRNLNNRGSYINDLTDDEDSEEEFIRSRGRRDRRQRVDSNSSLDFDDPEPNAFVRGSSVKHSRFNRDRRGASSARSLIDFPTSNKRDSHRSKYDREESFRDRFEKISLSSPRKVTSDSLNDSDGESNRRSNKSRSNNESFSSPRKITSDSMTNDSDADLERRRIARHQKAPTHQQIPKKIASDSYTNDSDAEFERRKQQKLKANTKRVESDSVTGDSDALREKSRPTGSRKISDTEKPKLTKAKTGKSTPKKIGSDSHTPDTDGEQKRRFTVKKTVKKHSSTEFIPNDSDIEFERRKEQKRKNSAHSNRSPPVASPQKSEDEEEEKHQKTVEIKNHINESKIEAISFSVEESPPPAAPIVAPDREWECEFCTYMNEAGVKVCAICCKTATIAIVASLQDSELPKSPPPDVVQEPLIEKQIVKSPHLALVSDVNKPPPVVAPAPAKEVDSKKKDNNRDEELIGVDEVVERLEKSVESLVEENQYENHEIRREPPIPIRSQCPKGGSGEIKQNLESEVVKDVKIISKEKVSTGCGPSPPRDVNPVMESSLVSDNRQVNTAHSSIGTSPPPQDISTQISNTMSDQVEDIADHIMESLRIEDQNQQAGTEWVTLLKEADRYKFTADELKAALLHCREKHPVQWLRDNWLKLIDTVQTLATKYGHEKRENTIGTISTSEAREALRLHKGNIWHAITECIEQRQRKYHEIASKGNFTREDIVTSLTAHHGNLELALLELSKTQLKPFLMRIWGPPNGVDNDSGNFLLQQALNEDRSGISSEIQEFISTHVEKQLLSNGEPEPETEEANPQNASPDDNLETASEVTETIEPASNNVDTVPSNTVILRDIEKLIDQMEKNQANQNEEVLKNIQNLLSRLAQHNESRPGSQASVRSDSCERIFVKSPIPLPRQNQPSIIDEKKPIYEDVRDFMAENIQEILPSLVSQVRQELETVPIRNEKTLEDDIRETLMNAEYSESEYSTIHDFPFKRDVGITDDFPQRKTSTRIVAPQEDDIEYANIQDFLLRAVRTEKITNEFERFRTQNYIFDSSSDEAKHTAESDYYDIVAVNQRIQDLLNRNLQKDNTENQQEIFTERPEIQEAPTQEPIYMNTAEIAAMATTVPATESTEKKQGKVKRRVSRIPTNKDNHFQRKPIKSSSESDFEVVIQRHKSPVPTVPIDHVEELRHVVDNLEKIQHELETAPDDLETPQTEKEQPVFSNTASTKESDLVASEDVEQIDPIPSPHQVEDPNLSEEQPPVSETVVVSVEPTKTVVEIDETVITSVNNEEMHEELKQSSTDQSPSPIPTTPSNPIVEEANHPLNNPQSNLEKDETTSSPVDHSTANESNKDLPSPNSIVQEVEKVPSPIQPVQSEETQPANETPHSPPKSPTATASNQDQSREDPSNPSLSKPSNNLSDLVLDTKRLIQQMKDEIASDMATMEDEDEIYDDEEYFEGDEYEEWSEGDENVEEWDSNEEYDVDENGDFYEYEDEDDDGSVMFSEIAPEDVVHPGTIESVSEEKPELPKISAALIREIERNSASEVSDLPLDSDFNDAMSMIEDSVGEISEILNMAVESLQGPVQLGQEDMSEAETVHNSPEASEISEVTLTADTTETTDKTLVAEENLNLTMRNVQSLMNAKAVIGGFIRTAQINDGVLPVEQLEQAPSVEVPNVSGVSSNDTELTQSATNEKSENKANAKTEQQTLEAEPQLSEQMITVEQKPEIVENLVQEATNATHELDATIEMLNSVARDLHEQLRQVSPEQSAETPENASGTELVNALIPEYATVNKNNKTGSLEESTKVAQSIVINDAPEYVNLTELQAMLAESDDNNNAEQYMISGYESVSGPQAPENSISQALEQAPPTLIKEAAIQEIVNVTKEATITSALVYRSSEKLDVSTVSEVTETISNANIESSSSSAITVLTSADQIPSNGTLKDSHLAKTENAESKSQIAEPFNKSTNTELQRTEEQVTPEVATVNENNVIVSEKLSDLSTEQDKSSLQEPFSNEVEELQTESLVVDLKPPDDHSELVQESQVTKQGTNVENQQNIEPANVDLAPIQPVQLQSQPSESSAEPAVSTAAIAQSLSSPSSQIDQPLEIVQTSRENITTFTEQPKPEENNHSTVQNQAANQTEQSQIVTNGIVHENSINEKTSREPSEEPSSFIEIQPSQVIIHTPVVQTQPSLESSNIYENVEITASTKPDSSKPRKLSLKIPAPTASNEQQNKKSSSSPSTPPTPSSKKTTTKTTKSKTKPTTATDTTKSKTSTTSDSSSRRNSLRKNSVGSPFGPVLTNTVKNMQKEFLSKAQKEPSKSVTAGPSKPKPSKLVQPKAFTNNKLTKPVPPTQPNGAQASTSTANTNSKASTPSVDQPDSARSTPGPSSSKGSTPGTSREGSLTSEQRRKLRKKYMETCFSDDYITSDDEEDPVTTVTESITESRTIIRSLVKPYEPNEEPLEVQAQRLVEEGHVQSYQQAELAVQLIEMRYAQDNAIWAATQCHTIEEAKDLLQKECELCLGTFPMNEIISMLKCTHTCCLDCAKVYFTEEIMHRSITNCNCPYCKEPDLNNQDVTEDDVLEYFSNLDILLKNIVDEEVHDLFQRKLRDRTLMQDPNFKWCVDCSSGFFARPRQKRLICPDCGSITCASCRKPWESQHEGLSCDQFLAWKEANDPELQAQGVARHLQANGISCPNCRFKYSLSRGGCMHFTCTQCKFEFCFGCNKPFMMGAKCDVSSYCAKLGLHAHHPRNCLFYLRDKEPRDLQSLLTMHCVAFDTEPSEIFKKEMIQNAGSAMKCPLPLQKETPAGLMDTICNGEVPEGYAGLCRTHYVEYLVGVVSKAQIDPLPILDLTDCVQELRRRGIALPERGPWDTDEIYREMCQKIVKDQIPLN